MGLWRNLKTILYLAVALRLLVHSYRGSKNTGLKTYSTTGSRIGKSTHQNGTKFALLAIQLFFWMEHSDCWKPLVTFQNYEKVDIYNFCSVLIFFRGDFMEEVFRGPHSPILEVILLGVLFNHHFFTKPEKTPSKNLSAKCIQVLDTDKRRPTCKHFNWVF